MLGTLQMALAHLGCLLDASKMKDKANVSKVEQWFIQSASKDFTPLDAAFADLMLLTAMLLATTVELIFPVPRRLSLVPLKA